ncbi:PREDICTED: actin-binding protein anillin-like isoform X7 [Poecilia mexicana]|uniref:actin-binding protein anillin-like isoform X7 n=1 Tax=Poecilia mexicana TaxID=48701 RepID=UPI00072E2241|nr:PREDICTED: actin-binding protein anillin-like isoform X7 [Poecilia mexicana]
MSFSSGLCRAQRLLFIMEAGQENGSNVTLKRPLSDTEDNNVPAADVKDGLKRRRLEAAGQENRSPEPSSSGRLAEFQAKPDTPVIPSVRSRVQLLAQRKDGFFAQRSFSHPGNEGPSVSSKGVGEHLLGEEEFHQRLERFKAPASQADTTQTPSPASSCLRPRSGFVSGIQQKLQCTTTPSSKQASIIRQERELELNQLPFQPISKNAWLKRCSSDSSITQGGPPAGCSSPSSWVPVSKRTFCWPPIQPWDVPGDVEMKDGSFTEMLTSVATTPSENMADSGSGSHDDTNSTETIEKMFEEVLEYAGSAEEEGRVEEDGEDHDSGIGSCSVGKTGEKIERQEEPRGEERDENEELLTFPQSGILSPLSKSFEAVVTPLRLAAAQESHPPPLPLSPEESSTPPQSAPLYSIDAYRTQRQRKLPAIQSVTPVVQRRTPETPKPKESNTKEKITALNEEAGKLQLVINQTLQALSCCTDVEHGRGSLEEAEAEKLLLVSCEKRSALLAEVSRLREERSLQTDEAPKEDTDYVSQHACRGTVNITSIQLPLKVEFVCSSNSRPGRPSHYFFVLIRYGPCNVIATPLATAADAQNGDTISFPTAVTLKDIRSSFEIDVEVYSLCTSSGSSSTSDRTSTKSRVTPRKFLNTLTQKSSNIFTSPAALNTRRSSNFSLVGSHKITLASLGCRKFPLDKMKLDGKIRKLLGDEFQEKVPFLSPLEGHIYLKLDSEGHSDVQHQGFLTMFELISGFGVWNRRYFVLEECNLSYWSNPNDRETKEAEGSISLSRSPSQCVRPVKRDSCARPFTFELVNASQQEDQNQEALSKCWFSADTKQERLDWMEKLNQALLDFHTWNRPPAENQASNMSNTSHLSNTSHSGTLTESIL